MSRRAKSQLIIETAAAILAESHPQTVRQVYYQLVSRGAIENNRGEYQAVSAALVAARKEDLIPWEHIEDRLRQPREVSMWSGLPAFAETAVAAYRRDVWPTQGHYLEVWLEKDALSGIFEGLLDRYGVTLNVGRGYDGWTSIQGAAQRYGSGEHTTVLYFGDFDPSGEDMLRSLRDRLGFFGCRAEIIKVALTRADIERYSLPPNLTKTTDSRRNSFVLQHGDISVELDALPVEVLRGRLREEVERRMDLGALGKVWRRESKERQRLRAALSRGTRR